MATIVKDHTFSVGATIIAAQHNDNFNTIYNDYNGNITNDNVASGALIALSKLNLANDATFSGDLTLSGDNTLSGSNTANKITHAANYGTHYTQGTAPSTAANEAVVYAKDSGTQPEIYVREESDGDEVQVTKNGRLDVQFGSWATDQEPAAGGGSATLAVATVYLAATDGFVTAFTTGANTLALEGYTDGSNPPTTLRANVQHANADSAEASIFFPVRKGDYWKVTNTGGAAVTLYWLPLGV